MKKRKTVDENVFVQCQTHIRGSSHGLSVALCPIFPFFHDLLFESGTTPIVLDTQSHTFHFFLFVSLISNLTRNIKQKTKKCLLDFYRQETVFVSSFFPQVPLFGHFRTFISSSSPSFRTIFFLAQVKRKHGPKAFEQQHLL